MAEHSMKSPKTGPGKQPNKGGRPPFEPTADHRKTVRAMVGYGMPQEQICQVITNPQTGERITKPTLEKHFRDEIDSGAVVANAKVAESLFKRATGYSHPDTHISNHKGNITQTAIVKHYPPDTVAAIFWLKNRQKGEWRDRQEVGHDVSDDLAKVLRAIDGRTRGLPGSDGD